MPGPSRQAPRLHRERRLSSYHRRLSRGSSRPVPGDRQPARHADPVGHTVIIPRRYFATLFDATEAEQAALLKALAQAKDILDRHHQPDGYNIGINHGQASGKTVPHLHVHLIPRYRGDKEDLRGGVRWVLPDKVKYWG